MFAVLLLFVFNLFFLGFLFMSQLVFFFVFLSFCFTQVFSQYYNSNFVYLHALLSFVFASFDYFSLSLMPVSPLLTHDSFDSIRLLYVVLICFLYQLVYFVDLARSAGNRKTSALSALFLFTINFYY